MRLSFVVTIDPVKDLGLLDILIKSLNLQTSRSFDVFFYNQRLMTEKEILDGVAVKPEFPYQFFSVPTENFLGSYPLWDLYGFHSFLLERNLLQEYFMSLHMEEFVDVDYVEKASEILARERFDILFGNLRGTGKGLDDFRPLARAATAEDFDSYLKAGDTKAAEHWSWQRGKHLSGEKRRILQKLNRGGDNEWCIGNNGFVKVGTYVGEDVYFMKRDFAERHNWFLNGHPMYFEDVHICEQGGVCELGKEIAKLTEFPVYFTRANLYHIDHQKYYYQLEDEEFTTRMLEYETEDPILSSLKRAITKYKNRELRLGDALRYTRQNPERQGTQNLNYQYHMRHLKRGTGKLRSPKEVGRCEPAEDHS
jgi:hypothetical protein